MKKHVGEMKKIIIILLILINSLLQPLMFSCQASKPNSGHGREIQNPLPYHSVEAIAFNSENMFLYYQNYFRIYDNTNRSEPIFLKKIKYENEIVKIVVQENWVFLIVRTNSNNYQIELYDVSNAKKPEKISDITIQSVDINFNKNFVLKKQGNYVSLYFIDYYNSDIQEIRAEITTPFIEERYFGIDFIYGEIENSDFQIYDYKIMDFVYKSGYLFLVTKIYGEAGINQSIVLGRAELHLGIPKIVSYEIRNETVGDSYDIYYRDPWIYLIQYTNEYDKIAEKMMIYRGESGKYTLEKETNEINGSSYWFFYKDYLFAANRENLSLYQIYPSNQYATKDVLDYETEIGSIKLDNLQVYNNSVYMVHYTQFSNRLISLVDATDINNMQYISTFGIDELSNFAKQAIIAGIVVFVAIITITTATVVIMRLIRKGKKEVEKEKTSKE